MQGSDWFGWDELTLFFFGFFVDYRYEEQLDLNYEKL